MGFIFTESPGFISILGLGAWALAFIRASGFLELMEFEFGVLGFRDSGFREFELRFLAFLQRWPGGLSYP